jgi:hypothetical protein
MKQLTIHTIQKIYWLWLCIVLVALCCKNEKSKKNHIASYPLTNCNFLYLEDYRILRSYFGSFTNRYLTDSINFRVFVGICDQDEYENYKGYLVGDSIIIIKTGLGDPSINDSTPIYGRPGIILKRQVFNLSKLRKDHRFE